MADPYQLPSRPATIAFADGSHLDGLELEVDLRCSMDMLFRIGDVGSLQPDQGFALLEEWARDKLLGWNLHGADGQPVPATPEGLRGQLDFTDAGVLLGRYYRAVSGLEPDFGVRSRSGATSATPKRRRSRRS